MAWSKSKPLPHILALVLLCLCSLGAHAQLEINDEPYYEIEEIEVSDEDYFEEKNATSPATLDSEADRLYRNESVTAPHSNPDVWDEVVDGAEFNEKDAPKEEKAPTQIDLPSSSSNFGGLFQIIVILAIAAILVLIIVKLSQGDVTVNRKVVNLDMEQIDAAEQNIRESDLERLLRLALEAQDYRMALRVRYLMILKELDSKGWITHSPEKTNLNYLMELSNRPESTRFSDLTQIFEYVWYAEITIPAKDDALFAREFGGFLTELTSTDEN